jgi:hypothetical protein
MSGILTVPGGLLANAGGNAFGSLLSGGAPPVVLGPVVFDDIEVPERIEFGGAQSMVVHKMPGGMRVIDAMGRDDMDMTWSGILEGPGATSRALMLDSLRVGGLPWTLTWDILSWTVIVKNFKGIYQKRNWIPYTIECMVVFDNSANFNPTVPTVQQSVNNDVATAGGDGPTTTPAVASQSAAVAPPQQPLPTPPLPPETSPDPAPVASPDFDQTVTPDTTTTVPPYLDPANTSSPSLLVNPYIPPVG